MRCASASSAGPPTRLPGWRFRRRRWALLSRRTATGWRSSPAFRAAARGSAARGGTVILRSLQGGGYVVVTAYGRPEQSAVSLTLDLSRLDRPPTAGEEEARSTTGVASAGVAG